MPSLKKIIFTAFFSLIIVFLGYFVVFAWTAPTSAPPDGNIGAPLNIGSVTQSKTGGLNVGGNIGIGTTNPGAKLQVGSADGTEIRIGSSNGSGTGSAGLIGWQNNSGGSYQIAAVEAVFDGAGTYGALTFKTDNGAVSADERMRINHLGNVGIGSTSPTQKLSVGGIIYSGSGGFKFPDGTTQTTAAGGASQWTTSGSNIYYNTGNVGIGTADPGAKLEVNGNVKLPNTATLTLGTAWGSGLLTFNNGATTFGSWGAEGLTSNTGIKSDDNGLPNTPAYRFIDSTGLGMFQPAADTLGFATLSNERMRIDNSGNVGIGTANPEAKLEVAGNVKIQGSINRGPTNLPLFRWLPIGIMATYSGAGNGPYGIAFDGVNMWTANPGNNSVTKITPTGAMTSYTVTDNPRPRGIAFDGTNMWIANNNRDSVTKITPTGAMTTYYGIGDYPIAIAFDGTNMWTANWWSNSVTKITPTGAMTTYTGTGSNPQAIAFDGTNMWTANSGVSSVTKITPTGAMATYSGTGPGPYGIAFDGTNMWTANYYGNSVTKITPTGVMTTYSGTGPYPRAIAFDGVNMWTVSSTGSSVTKITPTGTMTTYSGTGNSPYGIAFDGTNMWTANYDGNSVTKILVITQ